MQAILIEQGSAGPQLVLGERSVPVPGPTEVRIAVHAASVNRADLAQRAGTHEPVVPGSAPPVVGLDAAGEVIEVGSDVTDLLVGDRVMTLVGGGLSEQIVVDARLAIPIPQAWSYAEGAAAVLGLMTEHNALRTHGRLQPGDIVLVHAAASSVGLQCVQLAKFLGAGLVIGTTRNTDTTPLIRSVGADHVIVVGETGFSDEVLALTDGQGADVIVDHVGGPYLAENIRSAAIAGRLIGVGRLGGSEGVLDLEALAYKRLALVGVTFRTRSTSDKAVLVAALRAEVDLDAPELRPLVDRIMPWTEADAAQTLMRANSSLGKIVLAVGEQGYAPCGTPLT
ncbi:NAD(P)H-quinone oxidoreductase [Cryobacterium levicorallinum]|uniref:NAD(P)H-quinone oxidoreductase n=1 Tax=Cryobacterium levicorallinum TaxID=995038 RepID=A0A1I3APV8_9MICO|nr:zinc-binding dehydrogenase [Cryobacterium levicorallinum]TFB88050.1 NAD(P)H-quinone oxidoreductase [Cryobacterium levicorallinum]GEP26751.1 NAD(P)H quinone oxidoreductase [Cryobacterium levicorallinum]SFH52012.1 NADPH:quinone reductase [Cryobacterium levicorallinum]